MHLNIYSFENFIVYIVFCLFKENISMFAKYN